MTNTPDIPTDGAPVHYGALKLGDTLGPYTVGQQVEAGIISAAWRAQNLDSGDEVLIRELIPGSPAARERSFLERCEREVKKQKAIADKVRRVVLLKELVDDPRGAFLITDYVTGASVEQLLSSRPDPFDLVRGLRIVHAVAKVLEQLHDNGVIHSGLKPGNIVLRLGGGVQVCEAGLTALIADQEALSPSAAAYMAPEMFHGVAGDARSDIYSLGMIAYEMLVGRGAFEEAFSVVLGDRRDSAMRWMKWHTNARLQPPPMHELNPRVPVRLSDLVARMMAKDRSKRIASATQLLEAINRHFGTTAIEQAEASPDAFSPSGAQIKATGPGDTTELPPRDKRPMIAGIAAGVLLVLTLGIWLTVSTIKSNRLEQRRSLSRDALEDADRDYRTGNFAEALTVYESQYKDWPEEGDPLRLHGQAGALLARAQIDMEKGEYAKARGWLSDLDRMPEAGLADRESVKSLTDEVERREAFEKTIKAVQAYMNAGEFAQARTAIRETQREGLRESESQTLMDLQVRIDTQLETEQVNEALARADELAEGGDLNAAINHLTGLKGQLDNPRIEEQIKALTVRKNFAEAVSRGESAEGTGDYDAALRAFEEALAISEDEALSAKLLLVKARAAVEKGREMAESGDEAGALAQFTAAMGYDPENAEAKGWLARLNVTMEKRSQVEAGQKAEAAGDLVQAVGHYRSALAHGPDAELEEALARVESGVALARAEQLIASGKLEEAGEELDKAMQLTPDNPAVTEAVERHGRHVRYRELITRGDEFAEQGRFAQATQSYRQARDVMDTEEINRRLDDTEFNHLLAQARSYIANEQWVSARGILATAARVRITDELTALRLQVEEEINKEAKDQEGNDGPG